VAGLSERQLVDRIRRQLLPAADWLLVGIGDDAAVVEPERNRCEVLSVDAIVEGIHFDRAFVPADAIGYRALAVNLSDLAAMGAAPRLALLSMALPPDLALADFDGMVGGFARLASAHRIQVVGGNLTRSPGPLMIDVTVAGSVKRRQALTRSGARAGDEIYVSGSIGAAAVGLRILRETALTTRETTLTTKDTKDTKEQSSGEIGRPFVSSASSVVKEAVARYLYPEPRIRLGIQLARNRAASAAIDLSDGLGDGVHRIAEASGVGVRIDARALPIDPAVRAWCAERGLDPVQEAVSAGDDYELLFTVRPRTGRRLEAARRHGGAPLTCIGRCVDGAAVVLTDAGAERELPRGYEHFAPPAE
jgi:thiamine-monophosphate kinase